MSDLDVAKINENTATEAELCPLGRCLDAKLKPERLLLWKKLMFVFMALLLILNFLVKNEHPHFKIDDIFAFWPVFGLVIGVAMIFFVKKIIQPLIKRPEDYYGDI